MNVINRRLSRNVYIRAEAAFIENSAVIMAIRKISISGIRNLKKVDINIFGDLIFFQGRNGSGKTSIVEGIYLLGRGASFRSQDLNHAVNYNEETFVCFTQLFDGRRIGVSRDKPTKQTRVRIDGEATKSLSDLASQLPLLLVTPLTFDLLNGSPASRRRFLDWGVFHVEPEYKVIWQRWRKLLLQRNKLLKNGRITGSELKPWTIQYAETSNLIDQYRRIFFLELLDRLNENLLSGSGFTRELASHTKVVYEKGWSKQSDLTEQLDRTLELDMRRGFTSVGPHKADLKFSSHGIAAKEVLSRGQQKVLITHLLLAQLELLKKKRGLSCTVLIDDLGAELDEENQQQLLCTLLEKEAQIFTTIVDRDQMLVLNNSIKEKYQTQMFHVEQGYVTPITLGNDG